ncbi:MAG: hypothetical protein GEU26_11715 [Nitrososphaeraceae archaeon]|nr:hypothetical protein [Nitrososphaeraceae archaeon]
MVITEDIPIDNKLKNLGVTKFVTQGELVQIVVNKDKIISFDRHPKEFRLTMERFRESALNNTAGLSERIISKMEHVLVHPDNNYIQYLQPGNGNAGNESDSETLNQTYATVYVDKTTLYEAIIIDGIPLFAKVSTNSSRISLCTEIQIDEVNAILPLSANLYGSRPYEFDSEKEFRKIEHQVKSKENLDTLFQKVKAQWNLYIDNGKEHNIMCTGDTIFTYFQDKLGTTHYDFFVGDNGTGKSNNLHMFNILAYRNVLSSDMTAPNIYQLLGNDKNGVVTICEDEADSIDEDRTKMGIYKDGATTNINVFRTDISFGRKQFRFKTFCFKAFAAEELPDVRKAKGFRQRCITFNCTHGSPRYDIAEIIEPGGDKKLQQLLDDLFKLRNMLLIYRLLHYFDEIPNVELNIKDREKQLFKPTFRVFQKTRRALEELKLGINKYLSDYRERRLNTFHAALYKVITELIKREKTIELKSKLIWVNLKDQLQGRDIVGKSMSFECEDFGIIYQGSVTKSLQEIFGAERKKHNNGLKKGERYLKFDPKNLEKLSRIYESPTDIKVRIIGNNSTKNKREAVEAVEAVSGCKHGFSLKSKQRYSRKDRKHKHSKNYIKKACLSPNTASTASTASKKNTLKNRTKKREVLLIN